MNLSDPSDDDSSSDESRALPAKRPRSDTLGASSTTSHGSILPESESDEESDTKKSVNLGTEFQKPAKVYGNYTPRSSEDNNMRLSRSSLSENCSSANEDDFRPGFDENDGDSMRPPSFGDSESFYKKNIDQGFEDAYSAEYSEKSKRMMSSMGFKPGKGLGKFEHGRTEPVEASAQKGRRGLGAMPSVVGDIPKDLMQWSPEDTEASANEEVAWLPTAAEEPPTGDVLDEWLKIGPKKLDIENESSFVDVSILKGVLNAKTIFDSLEDKDLRHARYRSNPYETIGAVIFLNRAAVKMANIDAVVDFQFTHPKKRTGESAVDANDILYFADVCAGPGGFSEYVFYRKGWRAKGFGFTLKGANDFKVSEFYAGTSETFNAFYGVKEDGNVYDPANLTSLKEHVLKQTEDKGVHFLMADGGFSVEGQENLQEVLSKQLYLCQCLAALMLVRTGGHFVVKLFDIFTPFSVGLIYIMYRCFDKVCIHKPVTSRPANSERYLICFWKRSGTESVEQHLFSVNSTLWRGAELDGDVLQLVPMSVMRQDAPFYEYIYKSNCLLGENQIKHLLKIAAFSKDKNLKETCQAEIKAQCLKLWKLPDQVRMQPERLSPDETLKTILSLMKKPPPECSTPHALRSSLGKPPEYLEHPTHLDTFRNVYDWHLMFLSSAKNSPDLKIFIGCGGRQLFQLESHGWRSVVDLHVTMPAKTLFYGEIVKEYRGQGNNQIYSKALHIIDAMMLGGIDISHLCLSERITQCKSFCAALNKPFDGQALPMRCKRMFNLERFPEAVHHLEHRSMKRVKRAVTMHTPDPDTIHANETFYVVGSILFIKEIKEPWSAQISKSSGYKYYFSMGKDMKPRSEYYIPEEASLDMVGSFSTRVMWPWEPSASAVLDGHPTGGVSKADVEDFINHNIKR